MLRQHRQRVEVLLSGVRRQRSSSRSEGCAARAGSRRRLCGDVAPAIRPPRTPPRRPARSASGSGADPACASPPRVPTSATEAREMIEARCLPPADSGSSTRKTVSVSSTRRRVASVKIGSIARARTVRSNRRCPCVRRRGARCPRRSNRRGSASSTSRPPSTRSTDRHQGRLRDPVQPRSVGAREQESPIADRAVAPEIDRVGMVQRGRLHGRHVEARDGCDAACEEPSRRSGGRRSRSGRGAAACRR